MPYLVSGFMNREPERNNSLNVRKRRREHLVYPDRKRRRILARAKDRHIEWLKTTCILVHGILLLYGTVLFLLGVYEMLKD